MELVDHAFSRDVVRQAAEGLEADDAAASMMEKIRHVSGEEPSFAGAVAEREELGGSFGQPRDIGNLVETFGNLTAFSRGGGTIPKDSGQRYLSSCR